jgi:hypothetical protein
MMELARRKMEEMGVYVCGAYFAVWTKPKKKKKKITTTLAHASFLKQIFLFAFPANP